MLWPESSQRTTSGVLSIGNCPVTDLATEFGTPLYIFDRETLVSRAERMLYAFTELYADARIAYGGKAYLSPTILRLHAETGIGLDVVSGGELWGALKAGIDPASIVFHGNNKPADELRFALEQGIGLIALDNADEIVRLDAVASDVYGRNPALGTMVPVALRLNPGGRCAYSCQDQHRRSRFEVWVPPMGCQCTIGDHAGTGQSSSCADRFTHAPWIATR